jgi:hypothetical protein
VFVFHYSHYYRLDYGDNTRGAEAKKHLMTEEQKIILNENKRRDTRKSNPFYNKRTLKV